MKNKGQMTIIGIISTLITIIIFALVFMPIFQDIIANHTAGYSSGELLIMRSLGIIMLLGIVMGVLWYSSAVRERTYQ